MMFFHQGDKMLKNCPICNSILNRDPEEGEGRKKYICCPMCGDYSIASQGIIITQQRMKNDEILSVKLSHLIRKKTTISRKSFINRRAH